MPEIHSLKGKQKRAFRDALVSAFPNQMEFNELIEDIFEKSLNQIAAPGNIANQIYELIGRAIAQGKLQKLLEGAIEENPNNYKLNEFLESINFVSTSNNNKMEKHNKITATGNHGIYIQDVSGNVNLSQGDKKNALGNKKQPIKILFMAAYPDDKLSLSSEFDDIREKLKPVLDRGDLKLLDISAETDFDKLISRLTLEHPNVLHYSGHSEEEGLCLKNKKDGNTQLIEDFALRAIFDNRSAYLKLVFLNSCFSSNQAKIISEQGIYVLGIKNTEIEDVLAKKLAERFYLGFIQDPPISIEKTIFTGCFNFAMTYSAHSNLISLWKDGKEINYKNLKY